MLLLIVYTREQELMVSLGYHLVAQCYRIILLLLRLKRVVYSICSIGLQPLNLLMCYDPSMKVDTFVEALLKVVQHLQPVHTFISKVYMCYEAYHKYKQ